MTLYGTRLTHVYTSEEEITRVMTSDGVENFIADLVSDADYWTELVERATAKVNQFLAGMYDPSDLVNSIWVRDKATYIAAHFLSIREGHPGLYHTIYEEALVDLQAAKDNEVYLGIPTSIGARPVMQNVMHDNRFIVYPLRVLDQTSSRTFGGQQTAYTRPFWWW